MTQGHKIGEFIYNGDAVGVICDIMARTKYPYRVRWAGIDGLNTYGYDDCDISIFKKMLNMEVNK